MWQQKKTDAQCEPYVSRLEDAANAAAERGEELSLSADLASHVAGCEDCRAGVDARRLSSALLQWGFEPTVGPGTGFTRRVIAHIRVEEDRRLTQGKIFWRPLEHLAGRVALATGLAVLLLSFYVYAFVMPQGGPAGVTQADNYELVPHQQVDPQPQSKDDVLLSLVEKNNGH